MDGWMDGWMDEWMGEERRNSGGDLVQRRDDKPYRKRNFNSILFFVVFVVVFIVCLLFLLLFVYCFHHLVFCCVCGCFSYLHNYFC